MRIDLDPPPKKPSVGIERAWRFRRYARCCREKALLLGYSGDRHTTEGQAKRNAQGFGQGPVTWCEVD